MMPNSPPLKLLVHQLWKPNYERQGISDSFNPSFVAYIGVEDQKEYNNILATIVEKAKQDESHTLIFDNKIPFEPDFEFMKNIKDELAYIDVNHLKNDDFIMFPESYNLSFIQALQEIITLAIQTENFKNESVRNNFITKLLIEVYHHVQPKEIVDYSITTNKCIYYGTIEKLDFYFLLLLSKLKWDVIYINPLKEPEYLRLFDIDVHYNHQLLPIESLSDRARIGIPYQQFNSITLGFEQEVEQELFTDSGIFRPWQFKKGTTKNLFFNSTMIDLENNWNVESRMRQGFSVTNKIVNIPNFFYEIEGEYYEFTKYKKLINNLVNVPNSYISKGEINDFLDITVSNDEILQLTFCQLNDGTFDIEKLKELSFYKYGPFNDDTENFILNKINETLMDNQLFTSSINTKVDQLQFVGACLQLKKEIIRLIDSFDFPFKIPKIVIFLENEKSLDPQVPYILGLLHKIGFDIVILSPAGMSELSSYINRERFNQQRLETIVYDRTYQTVKSSTSTKIGFFSKLFGS